MEQKNNIRGKKCKDHEFGHYFLKLDLFKVAPEFNF